MLGNKVLYIGLLICLITTNCVKAPSTRSSVTEMWLSRCDIIIGSLEYYYTVNDSYPESLSELVPYYVSEFPVPLEDRSMLKYRKYKDSYELSFEHAQPDYKECRFAPALGWRCFAYE